jgi:Fe-S oxidoreductase
MALEDYRSDMETCTRCSACKFIPLEKIIGSNNVNCCPSISKYNAHAYSGGGRMAFGIAMLDKRLEYSDKLLEVVYNCQMCGACDISCKYALDMEVLKPLYETRHQCVQDGHTNPALDKLIENMRERGTTMPRNSGRGKWAEGLIVKDITRQQAEVVYFSGCRTASDPELWKIARSTVNLLKKAGVDVGIAGEAEICCGDRAYQTGYRADFLKQAQINMKIIKNSKAKILVTSCAECYHAFKVLYDQAGLKGDLEVYHSTEYLDKLIQEGKLKPGKNVNLTVTYHDPCHLGRLGEKYVRWEGKLLPGHMRLFDPPKEFRRGTFGIYEPPRNILKSIPGVKLVEMDRIKEYAWCCGAGGGVTETNPAFAQWTAAERIKEAASTGAKAIVTACPGCEHIFTETLKSTAAKLKIIDIVELLAKSVG